MNNGFYRWRRGDRRKLSPHFSTVEFDCRCGLCAQQSISMKLIDKLEDVREKYGAPITVTSGFRCQAYQSKLRKTLPPGNTAIGRSAHEDSIAADITGSELPALRAICEDNFSAVGVADKFIHVDMRVDKVRRWTYV